MEVKKPQYYYIYRFLDADGDVIYIGKTKHLENRLIRQHFTEQGHLPKECYEQTEMIEYKKFHSKSEMDIYEIYLINIYTPKYNKASSRGDDFSFVLPTDKWNKFQYDRKQAEAEKILQQAKTNYNMDRDVFEFELNRLKNHIFMELEKDEINVEFVKNIVDLLVKAKRPKFNVDKVTLMSLLKC